MISCFTANCLEARFGHLDILHSCSSSVLFSHLPHSVSDLSPTSPSSFRASHLLWFGVYRVAGSRVPVPRDSCLKLPSLQTDTQGRDFATISLLFSTVPVLLISRVLPRRSHWLSPTTQTFAPLSYRGFNTLHMHASRSEYVRTVDLDSRAGLFSRPSGKHCRHLLACTHSSSVLDLPSR